MPNVALGAELPLVSIFGEARAQCTAFTAGRTMAAVVVLTPSRLGYLIVSFLRAEVAPFLFETLIHNLRHSDKVGANVRCIKSLPADQLLGAIGSSEWFFREPRELTQQCSTEVFYQLSIRGPSFRMIRWHLLPKWRAMRGSPRQTRGMT